MKVGGGSYLSSHDPRIVLGLGKSEKLVWLEIKWPLPSGKIKRFTDLPIDSYIPIGEGEDKWKQASTSGCGANWFSWLRARLMGHLSSSVGSEESLRLGSLHGIRRARPRPYLPPLLPPSELSVAKSPCRKLSSLAAPG